MAAPSLCTLDCSMTLSVECRGKQHQGLNKDPALAPGLGMLSAQGWAASLTVGTDCVAPSGDSCLCYGSEVAMARVLRLT